MSKVQLPVHKNETVTGTVLDLTYQGNGVVKVDHYPIFVPNTLPGEEVTVKVTKVTKNFAWGKLISIEKKSPDRIDDPNWAYLQTGIAPLGNLTYPAQLKFKQRQIQELLEKAHLNLEVAETLGMDQPLVTAIRPKSRCGWSRANRRPVFTNVVAMTWCQLKTFTSRTRQLTKPFWWSATSCVSTKCRLTMKKLTAA